MNRSLQWAPSLEEREKEMVIYNKKRIGKFYTSGFITIYCWEKQEFQKHIHQDGFAYYNILKCSAVDSILHCDLKQWFKNASISCNNTYKQYARAVCSLCIVKYNKMNQFGWLTQEYQAIYLLGKRRKDDNLFSTLPHDIFCLLLNLLKAPVGPPLSFTECDESN